MKKTIAYSLIAVAAAFALPASTFAQSVTIKIGTVDMKKVFESYYKTKDAEAKINEARNAAKKELEDRMDELTQAVPAMGPPPTPLMIAAAPSPSLPPAAIPVARPFVVASGAPQNAPRAIPVTNSRVNQTARDPFFSSGNSR